MLNANLLLFTDQYKVLCTQCHTYRSDYLMKKSFSLTRIKALPVSHSGHHKTFHSKQREEGLSLKWQ